MMHCRRGALLPAMVALCLVLAFLAFPGEVRADGEPVSTRELIENAGEYDGREVAIEGEAVGDVMRRGNHAWITVNDDTYSERSLEEGGEFEGTSNYGISVWLPAAEADKIEILGGYKYGGDRVRVEGVFHRVDHENGGDMSIHGSRLEVIEPGHPISHSFAWWKLALSLALLAVVLVLGRAWWKTSSAP